MSAAGKDQSAVGASSPPSALLAEVSPKHSDTSTQDGQKESTEVELEYSRDLMERLNVFRHSSMHTDVVLCVSGREFPCHRNILAASSEVFNAMFSSSLKESQEGRVELHGTSENILKRLLDYVYTGQINVDSDSVQDLLVAASLYQYPTVVTSCCRYLVSSLDLANCLRIEAFARLHSCEALEKDARHFINENFKQIMLESEEFGELTADHLVSYLSSDQLDVQSESVVFDAIVRWISVDPAQRASESCRLLKHVRFGYIDPDYLDEHIRSHNLIASCNACSILLAQSIQLCRSVADRLAARELNSAESASNPKQTMGSIDSESKNLTSCDIDEKLENSTVDQISEASSCDFNCDARPSTVAREVLVLVAGVGPNMELMQTVEAYNPRKNRWTSLPDFPAAVIDFSTTVIENDIFVIGGETDGKTTAKVWRFISRKRCWVEAPSLVAPRSRHASAVWDTRLYVMGGIKEIAHTEPGNDRSTTDERRSARTVECLDLSDPNPSWTVVIPDIPYPRRHSVVIRFGPSLVEIGGTVNGFPSKMMDIYNCSKDETPGICYSGEQYVLQSEIVHAKFQFINGHFYIVWEDSKKVIALNPSRRIFKRVADSIQKHTFGGATLLDGFLYLAGGLSGEGPSKTVEKYDHNKNEWILSQPMKAERTRFGCVTISIS